MVNCLRRVAHENMVVDNEYESNAPQILLQERKKIKRLKQYKILEVIGIDKLLTMDSTA